MPVPRRPHDAAAEIKLDVVDAVLNLLANGLDEAVWAIARLGEFGGEGVPGRCGEEIAAGKDAWTDRLPHAKGMLHPDVDEVRHPCRADAHHASLQQPLPGVEPVLHDPLGQRWIGEARPFEMYM